MQAGFARTTEQRYVPPMAPDVAHGAAPLFRRIADALASAIDRGDYPVGAQLPPEFTLMRMFGASRFTIREALGELRSAGLISSRRGSGSAVLRTTPRTPEFGESYRSIDTFLAGVVEAPTVVKSITDVAADRTLASELGCEEGRQFVLASGVRQHKGHPQEPPMALVRAYINAAYGAVRPYLAVLTESLACTAEKRLGVRVQRIVQELEPGILTPEDAALLAAPSVGAGLMVRRWYYLDSSDLLMFSRSVYPKGRLVYRTELIRSDHTEGVATAQQSHIAKSHTTATSGA
jgi:GntR family transcriptional regulator